MRIPSTWRWLLPIIGAVFVAELGVMFVLPLVLPGEALLLQAVVDSTVLIALVSPFMVRLDRRRSRAEAEAAQLAEAQATLVRDLQRALAEVKTLSGLLPICAACKKIRDDQGYWNQIEVYLGEHSDVKFSHGVCPECARTLYGEFLADPGAQSARSDP